MNIAPLLRACLLACGLAAAAAAQAQTDRPISMVVAYPAGGQADVTGRTVLPTLQKSLGQTMIVENVAGAAGSIGAQKVRDAKADGQTLLAGTPIELVQTPMALRTKYVSEDFRLVGQIGSTYMMLVTRPTLPVNTLAELVALARKPGDKELSFGTNGRGSIYHLVAERFAQDTGVKMLHVPYKGAAQIFGDLAGGQIDLVFMPLGGPVAGMIQSGKFKPIAYTGPARHPLFPNVPTMNETGLVKDFVFDIWAGVVVPKATPEAQVQRLNVALAEALRQPNVRRDIEAAGAMPSNPMTQAEADRYYTAEIARYRAIGKAINLQPE
ncbi:MAG: tripartite tricarboxylate transporter substrate binding protein [Proteobacteria bacterium]|nr:tripartite tricarboxylate transporter substrate binding protein [Pseudomonadota bacterium]